MVDIFGTNDLFSLAISVTLFIFSFWSCFLAVCFPLCLRPRAWGPRPKLSNNNTEWPFVTSFARQLLLASRSLSLYLSLSLSFFLWTLRPTLNFQVVTEDFAAMAVAKFQIPISPKIFISFKNRNG